MEKMFKKTRKYLVLITTMIVALSMNLVAFAAADSGTASAIKSFAITNGANKKVSSVTLYANGDSVEFAKDIILNVGMTPAVNGGVCDFRSATNDRNVADVEIKGNNTIKITAKGNGKAVITLSDANGGKKTAKITVTVNTLVDTISYDSSLQVGKGGKLNLGATVTSEASNKKVTYAVTTVQMQETVKGVTSWVTSDNKGKNTVATVDSKGNVTGKMAGRVKVTIAAQDQKVGKDQRGETVTTDWIYVKEKAVDKVVVINPQPKDSNAKALKYDTIAMTTNPRNDNNKFQLMVEATLGGKLVNDSNITYTSNKSTVAVVDAKGKITAVGNGKATITAIAKDGTGAKATVNVNVTTQPDKINVPVDELYVAVNKTVKTGATVDKTVTAAGDKKLRYSSNAESIATVDAKGVVKGLAVGDAVITVTSDVNTNVTKKIKVHVANLATGVTVDQSTIGLELNSKTSNKDVATINAEATGGSVKDVTYKSSNLKVATVDADGNVTAVGKGKAAITATAVDGSKKSAKVNVTVAQMVYDIDVKGAKAEVGQSYDYSVTLVKDKTVAKLTVAANSNANNKTITMPTLTEAQANNIELVNKGNVSTISAKATAMNGTTILSYASVDGNKEVKVQINIVDNTDFTDQELAENLADGFAIKKGTSITPDFVGDDSIFVSSIKLTSSNPQVVAVKNGTITGKAEGEATVTVNINGKEATTNVRVVQSDADFIKNLNARVKATVNAENYAWMGVKPSYNEKASTIDVVILDTDKTVADAVNAEDAVKSVMTALYEKIAADEAAHGWIGLIGTDEYAQLGRDGASVKGEVNGVDFSASNAREAVKELVDQALQNTTQLIDLNGKSFVVLLGRDDIKTGKGAAYYRQSYTVNFKMDAKNLDAYIDAKINAQMAAYDLTNSGIKDITYNAADKTAVINIADTAMTITDFKTENKTDTITALKDIFAEVTNATIYANGEKGSFAKPADVDLDDSIAKLTDKLYDAMTADGKTVLGDLADENVKVDVTFNLNGVTYDRTYNLSFVVDAASVDANIDQLIEQDAAIIESTIAQGSVTALGTVSYDSAENKLFIGIKENGTGISAINNTGIGAIADAIITSSGAQQATLINGKYSKTYNSAEEISNYKKTDIIELLAKEGTATLDDLINRKLGISVVFGSDSKQRTLVYTFEFGFDMTAVETQLNTDIDVAISNIADNNITAIKTGSAIGVTIEDYTFDTTLSAIANTGLFDIFQAMMGEGASASDIVPVNVTAVVDEKEVVLAADATKGNILTAFGELLGTVLGDLDDKDVTIVVDFGNGNTLEYTVSFECMGDAGNYGQDVGGDDSDLFGSAMVQNAADMSDEDETIAEDTIVEVVEEATE